MFTSNWAKYAMYMCKTTIIYTSNTSSTYGYNIESLQIKDLNNEVIQSIYFASFNTIAATALEYSTKILTPTGDDYIIATGTPTISCNDYNISNSITSIANKKISISFVANEGTLECIYTLSGTYTGTETINITHLGLLKKIIKYYGTTTATFLMTHDKLDTPITLTPNKAFNIVYKVKVGDV